MCNLSWRHQAIFPCFCVKSNVNWPPLHTCHYTYTVGCNSDNPLCCPDKKEASSVCSVGSWEERTHAKPKTFFCAAVLSSHDSFNIDSCFQGKIQNKAHKTLCKDQWKQKKTITDASNLRRLTNSTVCLGPKGSYKPIPPHAIFTWVPPIRSTFQTHTHIGSS